MEKTTDPTDSAFARPASEDTELGSQHPGNVPQPAQRGITTREYLAGQALAGGRTPHEAVANADELIGLLNKGAA